MKDKSIAIFKFRNECDAAITSAKINLEIGAKIPTHPPTFYSGGFLVEINICCNDIDLAYKLCEDSGGELLNDS
jgi:hypothetical protein